MRRLESYTSRVGGWGGGGCGRPESGDGGVRLRVGGVGGRRGEWVGSHGATPRV